jgi:hypothetical protein
MREIAPLLHSRALFAESENFLLYDFWREDGSVDENVFAYSNRRGNDSALVIYHNRFATTKGTIHHSAAYQDKERGVLRQRSLHDGLQLPVDGTGVVAYRDLASGLEYLRKATDIAFHGLTLELHAYKYAVFLNWRYLVPDAEHPWDRLCDSLAGEGVRNLDQALLNLELKPVHDALYAVLQADLVRKIAESAEHINIARNQPSDSTLRHDRKIVDEEFFPVLAERGVAFLKQARKLYLKRSGIEAASVPLSDEELQTQFTSLIEAIHRVPMLEKKFAESWPVDARGILPSYSPSLSATAVWGPVIALSSLKMLGRYIEEEDGATVALLACDRLHLREPLAKAFALLGLQDDENWQGAARVKVGILQAIEEEKATFLVKMGLPEQLWSDPDVRWLLGVHDADNHRYFIKEAHEELIWWSQLPQLLRLACESKPLSQEFQVIESNISQALEEAADAGYCLEEEEEESASVTTEEGQTEYSLTFDL